jgi:coproporphyrinogen III oxidase-like Fe-S oxidoreductase
VVPRLGDWLARAEGETAPVVDVEPADERRNTSEALMLGLRLSEGISADLERRAVELEPARGRVIAESIASGLLERDSASGRLRFTPRGMILANEVLVKLV